MIAMRNDLTMRLRLVRLHLGLIAGACALLSLGNVAHAQQATDDDDDTFEQRVIKGILGGLGVNVGGAGIDYRERSPLVIPPSTELPPPSSSAAAAGNPAWPRDPERKKVANRNYVNRNATPEEPGTSSRLTPDEMRRAATPRAPRITDPSQSGSQEEIDMGRPMRPNELGTTGSGIFSWKGLTGSYGTETARFEGEPTRGSLTQPPAGYQTPSPSQPYGTSSDTKGGWKIPTILSRPEGSPDN
jgi:hypothetical protein